MSLAMSQQEREAFLAATHVGVLAVAQPSAPPLMAPVWYAYEPGGLVSISMEVGSRKLRLILEEAQPFSLLVQDETPPYKYVAIEGAVVEAVPSPMEERRALALRYFGPEEGQRYIEGLGENDAETMVRVRPVKWRTVDFAKAK